MKQVSDISELPVEIFESYMALDPFDRGDYVEEHDGRIVVNYMEYSFPVNDGLFDVLLNTPRR